MTTENGFELLRDEYIQEYNTRARLFRHLVTGAELLSLENKDENKVFGITFRTPPPDSTGLPHIMEHSVLCGSRKYPVKEPFVELIKGSLNTFLNAFTYPDKTCYPVASQNLQDFYNLIDVYLDAVFYPLIPPHILEQEGWHYELDNLQEPLRYKGVVFNEMKGAYSSPDSLLYRYSRQALFPENPYGLDSGGDPKVMPSLTYDQFKAFHQTYYHPSNARFYFYGDDVPAERLRLLDEYLKDFERLDVDSAIPLQPRFDRPRQVTLPVATGDPQDKQGQMTVSWLLDEDADPETRLGLGILSYILVGTPASPLRKALIDSGLGEDLAGVSLDSQLRQPYFSTGLKGIDPAEAGQVESLIFETLQKLVRDGIEPDMIEAAINTTEFNLRENNTGSFPRGLSMMLRALTTWLYDGDPLALLAFEAPLTAVKDKVAAGRPYFEDFIKRYFLENPHRVTLVLEPDATLRQQEEMAERERLVQVRESKSPAELKTIVENTERLKRLQVTPDPPEALAAIPSLTLADLDRENKTIPLDIQAEGPNTLLYHDLLTNGIVYLDLGFNLHLLPQELLPYVPLFGQALLEIGTEKEDFVKLSQRIGRKTGGTWTSSMTSALRETPEGAAWLFLRGKATMDQVDDLLAIWRDILTGVQLNNRERFKQMVLEAKAGYEAGLTPRGHAVVARRLSAAFNEADWAEEQMSGISQLFFLRQLVREVDDNWRLVLEKLEQLRRILLNRHALLVNVTTTGADWTDFRPRLMTFLLDLPTFPVKPAAWSPSFQTGPEGLTIPAQVNYVGKGANLYRHGYELHGSVSVITRYIRTTWLWERVRVQGGAYGGFSSFDRHSGLFAFGSYRDPNLLQTLEVYDGTAGFLRGLELNEQELTRAIIGAISQLDAYQLPDAKGYTSMIRYLIGDSDEGRQRLRDEILATRPEHFRALADVLDSASRDGRVVVMGSPEAIETANTTRPGWLDVVKVL